MCMTFDEIKTEMKCLENHGKAKILQAFFKTGKGEYAEGDKFLGLTSEQIKIIAKQYKTLELKDIQKLLNSKTHEHRMVALRILTLQYKKNKDAIFNFYLKNTKNINNWDLIDVTCPHIVGKHLLNKDNKSKDILYQLAKSNNLWEKRIAIISTYAFIKNNQFEDTLKISEILLNDSHDLIHKAVGWMLREVGNRNQEAEEQFLKQRCKTMPRTMLRYAIEKFPEDLRQKYLKGEM